MTNEVSTFLTETAWSAVVQLKDTVPEFSKLKEDVEQNWKKWKVWNNEAITIYGHSYIGHNYVGHNYIGP